jgi:hypothetical protein
MRCANCDVRIKLAVRIDIEDAVNYVFEGLVEDGYVPHRDEVEVLIYHVLDYLSESVFIKEENND